MFKKTVIAKVSTVPLNNCFSRIVMLFQPQTTNSLFGCKVSVISHVVMGTYYVCPCCLAVLELSASGRVCSCDG